MEIIINLGAFMDIKRLFTPLFACTLLTTQFCHAFWPLPTKRDIIIAGAATFGTFALVRNYYLGQEQRIRADIHTENDLTRSAVLAQGKETRNVVEAAGRQVITAVEDTHNDVCRVGAQTNMLLSQNGALAQMLLTIHEDQQRILASQRRIEAGSSLLDRSHNATPPLLEDSQPSSSQKSLHKGHSVQITALTTTIPSEKFKNLKQIPLQMQIKTLKKYPGPTLPVFEPCIAYGSTQDTSFSGRFWDIRESFVNTLSTFKAVVKK